jgi:hypothetical protein
MILAAVYRYRTLVGKCELGCGLGWDEIDEISTIEREYAPPTGERRGRRFRREQVSLQGLVRGEELNDRVEVVELGPGGLVIARAPFIARAETVEIVIDDLEHSYRFGACGVWLRDDGEDYRAGLVLVGMPICLNKAQISEHQADFIDQIAVAA